MKKIKEDKMVTNLLEQLLSYFHSGNWKEFFKIWDMLNPKSIKAGKDYKVLTFKLHIHFAIYPERIFGNSRSFRDDDGSDSDSKDCVIVVYENDSNQTKVINELTNGCMDQLKEYLNKEGKELEDRMELKPFFALPYTSEPKQIPFYSKIFLKGWMDELTIDLNTFIEKYDLIKIVEKKASDASTYISCLTSNWSMFPNNSLIISKDRKMPSFLDDDELRVSNNQNSNSRSTQTRISGMPTLVNCFKNIKTSAEENEDKQLIQCRKELELIKSHLRNVHNNYKKLKSRFHRVHGDYHKLMGVATELTMALENFVREQNVDLKGMLETCIKIFPDLFNKNIRDNPEPIPEGSNIPLSTIDLTAVSPKLLDFKKIKLHLINGNIRTKLLLLQALRWKITVSQPVDRDEAIHEYISSDLFGLHGSIASDTGKSVLSYLLSQEMIHSTHHLQQTTMRLLNAFASLRCGRDYLSVGPTVINFLVQYLGNEKNGKTDLITCDMILATLQKLSLRKQQRLYMIETGLVEWLICHLRIENQKMTSYRLEYATALLMNLSLHQQALLRASVISSIVVSTMMTLLSIENASALPYINGALNNFLTDHEINNQAKKMDLSSLLEYYRQRRSGELRKYLDHLLKIHKREYKVCMEEDNIVDEDNEELDVLENELEEEDPVHILTGESYGEALLSTYYIHPTGTSNTYPHNDRSFQSPQKYTRDANSLIRIHKLKDNGTIKLKPVPNLLPSMISQNRDKKRLQISKNSDDDRLTIYINKNQISKESSATTITSSGGIQSVSSQILTELEPFSSIASLDSNDSENNDLDIESNDTPREEIFLAKPKLPRTPPPNARKHW